METVRKFMSLEHRALDRLFDRALEGLASRDPSGWARFREELLRHIGLEEKILLPAVRRARGGIPDPFAERLRFDHGALAALLVPSPTPRIVGTVALILAEHEPREEGPEGLFDRADAVLGEAAGSVVEQMRLAPAVPVSPHNDDPRVLEATGRALARAGYRLLALPEVLGALRRLGGVTSSARVGEGTGAAAV